MIEWLTDRVGFAPGGVNIGVVRIADREAVLVDTGLNESAVRKVLRALAEEGRSVIAIITTHAHADHFGGNAFAVRRTGASVFAPSLDEAIVRYPLLQPVCLYAGADPPAALRTGFLLAEPSPVDRVYDAGTLEIGDVHLEAVSLAGHSGNQMGIVVDDVFFCADVVLPNRVIERYKMPYLYSVRDHVRALDHALEVRHQRAVPGHGPRLDHVEELVTPNSMLVQHVAGIVLDCCIESAMPEEILAGVLKRLGADPPDPPAYYLLHPTIFAYLTYLEERGEVVHAIEGGRSLWRRA